ncbi:MAG: hypothetical protein IGS03_01445 [Candidatus Sericytochromatia bacterium]|nr:hypothetical protein [Candidatus Sericytochromatia bacterium]
MNQKDPPSSADDYQQILQRTLMKRTGKPLSQPADHDQAAHQIFDRLLQEQRQLDQPQAAAAAKGSAKNKAFASVLDDLFEDESDSSDFSNQQTLAESNPLASGRSYQKMLRRTLEQQSGSTFARRRAGLRLEAAGAESAPKDSEALSREYSAALDEILGLHSADESFQPADTPSLTQTLYHQKLDDMLWPSQIAKAAPPDTEPPPEVNEDKIRSVVADYLRQLIHPEIYGLIAIHRQVLDEKYAVFWIRHTLQTLAHTLQTLETEFTIWVFMNHLDLIKPLLTQDFVERHRVMIEQMLPQKKGPTLFARTLQNQEQKLVFDRMINNKFEDVRRILRHYQHQFSREDSVQLFHFFRSKLPGFLMEQREALMQVLAAHSESATANPFLGNLLAELFFSDAFAEYFEALQQDPKKYKKIFEAFLRDKSDDVATDQDLLLPLTLVSMDLFHEKAAFFRRSERETLNQALDVLEKQLRFVPDASLEKESLMNLVSQWIEERVQAQFHLETQALQPLAQEITQLSQQGDSNARIRINHLNNIYDRHYQEMSDTYHKRRDTLNKLQQEEKPSGKQPSRKAFVLRKIGSCKQYLQRTVKLTRPSLQVQYREYAPEYLQKMQQELCAAQTWDNTYEEQVLSNVFEKANLVLKSLNSSKSTAQFNLKRLFDGEPRQEVFLLALQAVGEELASLEPLADDPAVAYVQSILAPYLAGLRFGGLSAAAHNVPTGAARIGYITAYLGHVSHIKLLLNQQYKQIIYDFHTLFGLTHALHMLQSLRQQAGISFEQHFRQSLQPAWDTLMTYCLMIGKGHYHFVANPLALHDYSWHPPLSGFGVSETDEEGFGLLELGEGTEDAAEELPAFSFKRRLSGTVSTKSLPAPRFGYQAEETVPDESKSNDRPERPALPPPAPGQRRLPVAPGKFELYSAPPKRQTAAFQIEEDNFYQVLSQTQAGPAPEMPQSEAIPSVSRPSIPPLESPEPPAAASDDDSDFGLLSFDAEASVPTAPPPTPPVTDPLLSRRKRWLEITPVPDEQNREQLSQESSLDSDLSRSQAARVEGILKRNRLNADMPVDGNTSVSRSFRRRLDLDD